MPITDAELALAIQLGEYVVGLLNGSTDAATVNAKIQAGIDAGNAELVKLGAPTVTVTVMPPAPSA